MPADDTDPYPRLLEAIDSGAYPPGTRLIETELAARFGVSRTPVRQALSRLEAQGIAARDARGGLVVATLDYDQLGELYEVREMAEALAARLAARHASPTEIGLLDDLVAADRLRADDVAALAHSNKVFHQQLHRASHNRYLVQTLGAMRRSLSLLSGTTLGSPGRGAESVEEHAAIVAAIAARDEDGAEAAARRHITNALRARLRLEAGT
jgi:DNA-binding GntR family transcriptional regulator